MIEYITGHVGPLMFAALAFFLMIGYPVTFSLGAIGLSFGYLGIQLGLLTPALFGALPERIFGIMHNETLLAVPFFTFMGLILERSGMAEARLGSDSPGRPSGRCRAGAAERRSR